MSSNGPPSFSIAEFAVQVPPSNVTNSALHLDSCQGPALIIATQSVPRSVSLALPRGDNERVLLRLRGVQYDLGLRLLRVEQNVAFPKTSSGYLVKAHLLLQVILNELSCALHRSTILLRLGATRAFEME